MYENLNKLIETVSILRSPNGCEWDREQTHQTLRKNMLEEAYEAVDAIDNNDAKHLREELGDVLLQVVFHTQMENEAGNFNIDGVAHDVCAKLVHRHPHIFGDVVASTSDEVLSNWEAIKNVEKSRETMYEKLSSVPPMTPSLMRASKVAKKSGEFNEKSNSDIIINIENLLALMKENEENIEPKNMGEILFLLGALSSKTGIDAEESLFKKTNSFVEKYKD